MRRTLVVGAAITAIAVLALPAVRRTVATRTAGLVDLARERLAAFRSDYAQREAQLRADLLPTAGASADAARHRSRDHATEPPDDWQL